MIPSYVRRWHRDAEEAVEADEDGVNRDVYAVDSASIAVVVGRLYAIIMHAEQGRQSSGVSLGSRLME